MLLLLSFVAGPWSFAAPATAPATGPSIADSDDIDWLIRRLSDDSWQQRQAAQDRLVLLGDEARGALEDAANNASDDETRSRAQAILVQIAENRATGPSIITLHLTDASPRAIFEQLSRQCGAPLEPSAPDFWQQKQWANIPSLDIDHQPFWTAMQQISARTGIELRQWNTSLKLVAVNAQDAGPRMVSGPFLVVANRIVRNEAIELGAGRTPTSNFSITFTALAEPKIRVLRAGYMARIDQADDDRGNSLVPAQGAFTSRFRRDGSISPSAGTWPFQGNLVYPQINPGKRIVRVKGSVDASLQTRFVTLEFPDIVSTQNVSRTGGGVRVVVHQLKRNGELFELKMTVSPDQSTRGDWERIQQSLATTDLKLVDDQGLAYIRSGYSAGGGSDRLDITAQFAKSPWANTPERTIHDPARLVWNIPTQSKEITLPFEFNDLPIP